MKKNLNSTNKERLDNYLVKEGYCQSKSQAQGAILSGKVKVNGEVVTKAGTQVKPDINVEIKHMPYVSRGGFKLEKAVKEFKLDVKDKICLDIGASTGGFTDFLLQNGAQKVYAIDVGYGQLAWKLRNDPRVVVMEKTNIRNLKSLGPDHMGEHTGSPLLAVADVSFISLTKVLENIKSLMSTEEQELVLLVKPQFEAGKEQVPKSGVIKDKEIHEEVIGKVADFAAGISLFPINLTYSPITGPAGNIEYLLYLSSKINNNPINITETVETAHENFKSRNNI